MKALVFFSLVLFSTLSFQAQRYLYVRPMASMKANVSSFLGPFNGKPLNFSTNPHYTLYNYGLHLNNNEINLGINFGLKLDAKNAVELSFSGDNASIKSSFVYQDLLGPDYIVDQYSTSSTGSSLHRISAEYHRVLGQNKNVALRSTIGLGVYIPRNANGQINEQEKEFTTAFYTATGTVSSTSNYFISPVLKIGAGFDIKNKKGNPFCSLDISYIYNTNYRSFVNETYKIQVTDINQATTNYLHTLKSNGTGINFQLSFPIKVYEFK